MEKKSREEEPSQIEVALLKFIDISSEPTLANERQEVSSFNNRYRQQRRKRPLTSCKVTKKRPFKDVGLSIKYLQPRLESMMSLFLTAMCQPGLRLQCKS